LRVVNRYSFHGRAGLPVVETSVGLHFLSYAKDISILYLEEKDNLPLVICHLGTTALNSRTGFLAPL